MLHSPHTQKVNWSLRLHNEANNGNRFETNHTSTGTYGAGRSHNQTPINLPNIRPAQCTDEIDINKISLLLLKNRLLDLLGISRMPSWIQEKYICSHNFGSDYTLNSAKKKKKVELLDRSFSSVSLDPSDA